MYLFGIGYRIGYLGTLGTCKVSNYSNNTASFVVRSRRYRRATVLGFLCTAIMAVNLLNKAQNIRFTLASLLGPMCGIRFILRDRMKAKMQDC